MARGDSKHIERTRTATQNKVKEETWNKKFVRGLMEGIKKRIKKDGKDDNKNN